MKVKYYMIGCVISFVLTMIGALLFGPIGYLVGLVLAIVISVQIVRYMEIKRQTEEFIDNFNIRMEADMERIRRM